MPGGAGRVAQGVAGCLATRLRGPVKKMPESMTTASKRDRAKAPPPLSHIFLPRQACDLVKVLNWNSCPNRVSS